MRPSNSDILIGIRANIEELMLPDLLTPHAQSSAQNAMMLLDHVVARLDQEGAGLAADNTEKRQVLSQLAESQAPEAARIAATIEKVLEI